MDQFITDIMQAIQADDLDRANQLFADFLHLLDQTGDQEDLASYGYQMSQYGFVDYAQAIYNLGEKNYPGLTQWLILQGELAMDNGDYETGIDYLLLVDDEDPLYLNSLLLQADAYQMLSLPEVSLVKLQEAQALAPDQDVIAFGIAELAYMQGDFKTALAAYQALLTSKSLDASLKDQIHEHYAYALAQSGQLDQAIDLLSQLGLDQLTQDQKNLLAILHFEANHYETARGLFDQLYHDQQLKDTLLASYADLADHFYDYDQASQLYQEAIAKNPFQSHNYLAMARLKQKVGQLDLAIDYLKQALDLEPDYAEANLLLLTLYIQSSDFTQANHLVDRLDRADFNEPHYHWLKARLANEQEDYDQARANYQLAYAELKADEDFLLDYMTFLREDGQLERLAALAQAHPHLMQNESGELANWPGGFADYNE
ncbi:hypothetical protein AWM75_06835 [Aerococcus urinaehominis]|uniref:Uncharacterized protein n=1 Tax=Aerococcus urinaehominis TaxID=128944 RepID=A0A109RGW0_9LACT|nr:tetratricopeptide repeat protein [Aerococcus urinaehominis]AMB99716.1 hypothetical protein AWM75_06835 [Aerococcus urinaehominis]SDL91703.1 Tetratricopeptide repeat-containing protein [Aerococcus urinaehominis]